MCEYVVSISRRLVIGVVLPGIFVMFGLLGGCTFNAEHNRAHWESFKQDTREAHKFVDKTFFHYDWDDPDNWYIEQQ